MHILLVPVKTFLVILFLLFSILNDLHNNVKNEAQFWGIEIIHTFIFCNLILKKDKNVKKIQKYNKPHLKFLYWKWVNVYTSRDNNEWYNICSFAAIFIERVLLFLRFIFSFQYNSLHEK